MVIKGDRHANSVANYRIPADHRRNPRSLPGRWRWCDRPWLCDAQKASALHTLIHQRHPTPSCGGHAPTAERTMIPARMCLESLDRRPGIREQPGSKAPFWQCGNHFRSTPISRRCQSRRTSHSYIIGLIHSSNRRYCFDHLTHHLRRQKSSETSVIRFQAPVRGCTSAELREPSN
jgi:hypothetical protein